MPPFPPLFSCCPLPVPIHFIEVTEATAAGSPGPQSLSEEAQLLRPYLIWGQGLRIWAKDPHRAHIPATGWPASAPAPCLLCTKEGSVGGKCSIGHLGRDRGPRLTGEHRGPTQGIIPALPFPATLPWPSCWPFFLKCHSLPMPQETQLRPLPEVKSSNPPQPPHRPGGLPGF